ncbi:MAG: 2,3-bisphosphoglycerate-independent phosphoglycerate mutase, partial [bacterium]
LVLDGLGGLPGESGNRTELETAHTPNLDTLAEQGICGLHQPIDVGITPGSGPAHLSLFGYDPIRYQVGRGVLSALGIDFDLTSKDVAARGNFCTVNDKGKITDRRAGRISTEKNKELCDILRKIELPDTKLFIETVKEHRFLLVLRNENLSGEISDTDPQAVDKEPLEPEAKSAKAEKTAELVLEFIRQAQEKLSDQHPANMVLLRGFSQRPDWPSMKEIFQLNAAAIATYPMYRGVAKLVGMETLETGNTIDDEFATLEQNWENHDFFFVHIKSTDSAGEDGDFQRKVKVIEEADEQIPRLLDLVPDVLIVTGDHSTPSFIGSHSWHPVPVIVWSKSCLPDKVDTFGERACMTGGLGPQFSGVNLMPLAMANALRLEKFGA